MEKRLIEFNLNGEKAEVFADPAESLLFVLRERLGLTGTKEGCGQGECGACTVFMEGRTVNACLVPAGKVEGKQVLTIEGLTLKAREKGLAAHPLQEAFVEKGAVQCGFCTPGMIISAYALLKENRQPSTEQIRMAISGNLCRCTGYKQIEAAILEASKKLDADLNLKEL
ncbi:MAG: (2Fe-2S)-binding protein [Bacillota bacterium]